MKRERRTNEGTFLTLKHFLHFLGKELLEKDRQRGLWDKLWTLCSGRTSATQGSPDPVYETGARLSQRSEWHHRSSYIGV